MTYLLDTCTVSDFAKGEPNTLNRLRSVSPSEVFISSITLMEIRYGMAINPKRVARIWQVIEDFLSSVTIIPLSEREAVEAASIRSLLKTQGLPIGYYDVLIAATAKANKLIIVTANVREFERVPGLIVLNWRNSS
jgi:tRNA(fMet)-specific endonuclease VapC